MQNDVLEKHNTVDLHEFQTKEQHKVTDMAESQKQKGLVNIQYSSAHMSTVNTVLSQ